MRTRFLHIIFSLKLLALSLVFLHLSPGAEAQQQANAAQIKATFLYHFSSFVEWPPGSFAEPGSPLIIGILGADPFGNFLDELVEGEKAGGHPIVIQRFSEIKEVKKCHILFINSAQPAEALKALVHRSILSVGDSEQFIRSGGIIRFFLDNGKIRLEISKSAARQAKLNISSKLLRVAKTVN